MEQNLLASSPLDRAQAQVAQSVEQRTENPRVGGSIPPLGILFPLEFANKSRNKKHALGRKLKRKKYAPPLRGEWLEEQVYEATFRILVGALS